MLRLLCALIVFVPSIRIVSAILDPTIKLPNVKTPVATSCDATVRAASGKLGLSRAIKCSNENRDKHFTVNLRRSFQVTASNTKSVFTIEGNITFNGNGNGIGGVGDEGDFRLFKVSEGAHAEFVNLGIENFYLTGSSNHGAALFVANKASAVLREVQIKQVSAAVRGGAIANKGTLFAYSCIISENRVRTSSGHGGGILNQAHAKMELHNCEISSNTAGGNDGLGRWGKGGGVYNEGELVIDHCSLESNMARNGGGLMNTANGEVSIHDSTIKSNLAIASGLGDDNHEEFGGGICNSKGTVSVLSSIIASNEAGDKGGGAYNTGSSASLTFKDCELKFNKAGKRETKKVITQDGENVYNHLGSLEFIDSSVFTRPHARMGKFQGMALLNNGVYNDDGTVSWTTSGGSGKTKTSKTTGVVSEDVDGLVVPPSSKGGDQETDSCAGKKKLKCQKAKTCVFRKRKNKFSCMSKASYCKPLKKLKCRKDKICSWKMGACAQKKTN